MKNSICKHVLPAVLATFLSAGADAALFRAYLAPDGSDANQCTLQQPCRLLPAALAVVADGGEIWILDTANYNNATVVIDKSVTIMAVPGAIGSVIAVGGPAISITAPGLKVALRNLVIVPLIGGGGTNAVTMTGASDLSIEQSLIANLASGASHGVQVTGAGKVRIVRTTFRDMIEGFALKLESGATGSIANSTFLNVNGIISASGSGTTRGSIADSSVHGGQQGVAVNTGFAGDLATIQVARCTFDGTSTALSSITAVVGTAAINLSSSVITNANFAWAVQGAGATINTFGNNHFSNNAGTIGSLTPVGLQ